MSLKQTLTKMLRDIALDALGRVTDTLSRADEEERARSQPLCKNCGHAQNCHVRHKENCLGLNDGETCRCSVFVQ